MRNTLDVLAAGPRGRSTTHTGFVIPRVFQTDTPEDNQAVQAVIDGIQMYPLAEYAGKMKHRDWRTSPKFPAAASGDSETKWVTRRSSWSSFPSSWRMPARCPGGGRATLPVPQVRDSASLQLEHAGQRRRVRYRLFHSYRGRQVEHLRQQAERDEVLHQDLDASGARLNGANRYTVTSAKDGLPPVDGFWSLTLYNEHHFFAPNPLGRYSLGTKNKGLQRGPDGSLTLYVQADSPGAEKETNWLPAPKDADFSLYVRAYWPQPAITSGAWTPPAVAKVQ